MEIDQIDTRYYKKSCEGTTVLLCGVSYVQYSMPRVADVLANVCMNECECDVIVQNYVIVIVIYLFIYDLPSFMPCHLTPLWCTCVQCVVVEFI
jgi:hypothetical protein